MNNILVLYKKYLYIFSDLPTCGNLITFMQFAFIAVEGLIFTAKFGMIKPKIPIRYESQVKIQ